MPATKVPPELFYYVGEKPPALPWRYEDKDGTLIATISGADIVAKCKVDENDEFDVTCTNTGDGTGTVDWATGTSSFEHAGIMKIDMEIDDGTRVWFMPRFSIPVKTR